MNIGRVTISISIIVEREKESDLWSSSSIDSSVVIYYRDATAKLASDELTRTVHDTRTTRPGTIRLRPSFSLLEECVRPSPRYSFIKELSEISDG